MGFIFAALFAGYRPNTMPTSTQKAAARQHGAGFDGDDDVQRAQYNRGIITFVSQFCQICQDNFIL